MLSPPVCGRTAGLRQGASPPKVPLKPGKPEWVLHEQNSNVPCSGRGTGQCQRPLLWSPCRSA